MSKTPAKTLYGVEFERLRLDRELKAQFPFSNSERYVSLVDCFCDTKGCDVFYGENVRDGVTSMDNAHLTPIASQKLAKTVLVDEVRRGFDE